MLGEQRLVGLGQIGLDRPQLRRQCAKRLFHQLGQCVITRRVEPGEELRHVARSLRHHHPELRTMPAQRVDRHHPLTAQQLARAMQHQQRLLRDALHRHEAHLRPLHRLADRRRIGSIVLVRLDVGAHVLRRQDADLVPETDQRARPVMRPGAGFHPDPTTRQPRKELLQPAARQALFLHRLTPVSYTHLTLPTNREV